jgi:hypothetical protein
MEAIMNELTYEWLKTFAECKTSGENLANSVFWRLALHALPLGVDGNNPEVRAALKEIQVAVEKRAKS